MSKRLQMTCTIHALSIERSFGNTLRDVPVAPLLPHGCCGAVYYLCNGCLKLGSLPTLWQVWR